MDGQSRRSIQERSMNWTVKNLRARSNLVITCMEYYSAAMQWKRTDMGTQTGNTEERVRPVEKLQKKKSPRSVPVWSKHPSFDFGQPTRILN